MFSKFYLKDVSFEEFETYEKAGRDAYEEHEDEVRKDLHRFLKKDLQEIVEVNDIINGTGLKKYWFPTKKYDVFLSHSHIDEKIAIALAGFLKEELGLTTFIDSCVWGYSDDLLREIDKEYCRYRYDKDSFDYNKRNVSISHVHMMLSIAIAEMIDRCESIFLLNTPHSISLAENIKQEQTNSPWIYNELVMANIIRIRPIEQYREEQEFFEADLKMEYKVSTLLQSFVPLTMSDLQHWARSWKNDYKNSLDYIYDYKNINPMLIES